MIILVNDNREIIGCALVGSIADGIEINKPQEIPEDLCENYSFIDEQIVYKPRN